MDVDVVEHTLEQRKTNCSNSKADSKFIADNSSGTMC